MAGRWVAFLILTACVAVLGCSGRNSRRETPLPPGVDPNDLRDATVECARPASASTGPCDHLVLGGLGSRSLYTYGVINGWADSGTMPDFQVITGVGGGTYAAIALFAGREYLPDLPRIFLGFDQRRILRGDAWDAKRFPHPVGIGTDSVATTKKIREQTRTVLTPEYFAKVAAEHAKGRRLYVGTTNLDTQRFTVWDMGAIASGGTAESRKLFEDVLVASTAVPPLLEPSRIAVAIDGKRYEEMHAEGGLCHALFWQPPEGDIGTAGTRVHVVLGNKVYSDPEATQPKLLDVTLRSMKGMFHAIQRGDLTRLSAQCRDRDLTMRVAVIPAGYDPPLFHTDVFDPAQTKKLYREGYTRGHDGTAWDDRPPEEAESERRPRRGTTFTTAR